MGFHKNPGNSFAIAMVGSTQSVVRMRNEGCRDCVASGLDGLGGLVMLWG